jgi:hypothetical protein
VLIADPRVRGYFKQTAGVFSRNDAAGVRHQGSDKYTTGIYRGLWLNLTKWMVFSADLKQLGSVTKVSDKYTPGIYQVSSYTANNAGCFRVTDTLTPQGVLGDQGDQSVAG